MQTLAQAFERAAADPDAPDPPISEGFRAVLSFHADGELGSASTLMRSIQAYTASPRGLGVISSEPLASQHRFLEELEALPEDLPPRFRAAIATALLAGDVSKAHQEITSLSRRDRHDARLTEFLLRRHAPSLWSLLVTALDVRERWHERIDGAIHRFLASRLAKVSTALAVLVLTAVLVRNYRQASQRPKMEDDRLIRDSTRWAADKARASGQGEISVLYDRLADALLKDPASCAEASQIARALQLRIDAVADEERRAMGGVLASVENVARRRCPGITR